MNRRILLYVIFGAVLQGCTGYSVPRSLPTGATSAPPPVTITAPPPYVVVTASPPPAMVAPTLSPPKGEVYPLWYATNRKPREPGDESQGYSSQNESKKKIHYGKVFVEIPEDFLERHRDQGWLKKLLFKSAETELKVRAPIPLSANDFLKDIKDELKPLSSDERIALIYLHGFQTTFEEAAQRAAGIGYQLKIPITTFFSWPSKGKLLGYEADRASAELSEEQIAEFLIKFVRNSGASKVHVIAHSMGNYALLRGMLRPVMQAAIKKGIRFGQVILAAPDVETGFFLNDAPMYNKVAERVTLYASSKDYALTASSKLAVHDRAGLMPPATVATGIDTIDVSAVNMTFLGHSYVADEIAALEDMHKLISHNEPPEKRTRLYRAPTGNYWILR